MKIAKILPAIVGFTLVPAAGTFAADSLDSGTAGLDFAAPTTQMSGSDFFSQVASNLRWSVSALYALDNSDQDLFKDDPALYGIDFRLSFFADEKKELFFGLSYLFGNEDIDTASSSLSGDADIYRWDIYGGFNYWFQVSEKFDINVGIRCGVTETSYDVALSYSSSSYDETIGQSALFGAIGVGLAYEFSEVMRIKAGIEYTTWLSVISNDYYESEPFSSAIQANLGLEFKF